MQRIIATIAICNFDFPHRQNIQNFWMNFYTGFYYDENFWERVFFPLRMGKQRVGVIRLTFRDENTGTVVMERTGSDVPKNMEGYWARDDQKLLSLGVKMRMGYNVGRSVYRTFPAMLDARFFTSSDRDELLSLSSTFWNAYNNYWTPNFLDPYVNHVFLPGSDVHFSQEHYPVRWCSEMVPISVGFERRFNWIPNA